MKQDDALEMFVRFNSGGKALRKSEITMSILYEQDHLHPDNRFNESKPVSVLLQKIGKDGVECVIVYLIYICLKVDVTVAIMICDSLIITMI